MTFIKIVSGIVLSVATLHVAYAADPKIPTDATPLNDVEIEQIVKGKVFNFVAYDEPLTGTSLRDSDKGTVSGKYVWDKTQSGTYTVKWYVENGKSCVHENDKDPVCQIIYSYKNGFMEVNSEGKVHAVSIPAN